MADKCLGIKITGNLQKACPKRKFCQHYLDAKPEDNFRQPKGDITSEGCNSFRRKG